MQAQLLLYGKMLKTDEKSETSHIILTWLEKFIDVF